MEIPKKKRPPKDIWDKPDELDRWFDAVFDSKSQTGIELVIDDIEG